MATLWQESAISVPPLSALKPPNDGITSPPCLRSSAICVLYRPAEIGCFVHAVPGDVQAAAPFLPAAWMKASVRNFAPDLAGTVAIVVLGPGLEVRPVDPG